jgi:hypothetical protein
MALSVGFRVSVSLHPATQATGPRLLPRWDCLPLSVPAFPGRTGLLSVHSRYGLYAHRVTNVTLYTESSDGSVTLAAASIATGWSEPVPGWELHPLKSSAFHGALLRHLPNRSAESVSSLFTYFLTHRIPSIDFFSSAVLLLAPPISDRLNRPLTGSPPASTEEAVR